MTASTDLRKRIVATLEAAGCIKVDQTQLNFVVVYRHPRVGTRLYFVGTAGGVWIGPNWLAASKANPVTMQGLIGEAT